MFESSVSARRVAVVVALATVFVPPLIRAHASFHHSVDCAACMATCRTQDLVAGLYNGSLGMLEEHFGGECDGGSSL
jgi:hypothetical protein